MHQHQHAFVLFFYFPKQILTLLQQGVANLPPAVAA
jgi:hypothetical protein